MYVRFIKWSWFHIALHCMILILHISYCDIAWSSMIFHGPELHWYCWSDPEWPVWHWCCIENLTKLHALVYFRQLWRTELLTELKSIKMRLGLLFPAYCHKSTPQIISIFWSWKRNSSLKNSYFQQFLVKLFSEPQKHFLHRCSIAHSITVKLFQIVNLQIILVRRKTLCWFFDNFLQNNLHRPCNVWTMTQCDCCMHLATA